MIKIREAKEEDRSSAIRVLWKAFEAQRSFEEVEKEDWVKRWNRPEKEDWAFVAVDGDTVAANLCFFASNNDNNIIRGNPLRFAGVWAVATDPVYRKQGLVRELFKEAFLRMHEEQTYLSILDPFKGSFYEQFDYALGEKRAKHIFTSQQLRPGPKRDDIRIREAQSLEDAQQIIDIERSMTRFGSRFWGSKDYMLDMIKRGHYFIFEDSSGAVGTAKFYYSDKHPGYNLIVGGTCYKSDDIFPSIVNLVSNHAVNAAKITWYTDYHMPVRHYFSDYSTTESYVIGSMMMRVIDFQDYCTSIKIPENAREDVIISLEDDYCPWNSGTYHLVPNNGRLEIELTNRESEIKLNAFQLSQVISGVSPASMLKVLGNINCSQETAKKIEVIFPEDIFVSRVRF